MAIGGGLHHALNAMVAAEKIRQDKKGRTLAYVTSVDLADRLPKSEVFLQHVRHPVRISNATTAPQSCTRQMEGGHHKFCDPILGREDVSISEFLIIHNDDTA